jgi:hypothetical protein
MNHDILGWMAALATLACFASSEMLRLRILALVANVAFVAYATQAGLLPVLVLHLVLAPVNAWRLWQLVRARLSERPFGTQPASLPVPPAGRRGSS